MSPVLLLKRVLAPLLPAAISFTPFLGLALTLPWQPQHLILTSSFCPIIWIFLSDIFPFSFFLTYTSVLCFYFCFFLEFIHPYLSSQRPFRWQPLIFLILVCYIKVSKELLDSQEALWFMTIAQAVASLEEQNKTEESRGKQKANAKCHKPLVSKGSLQSSSQASVFCLRGHCSSRVVCIYLRAHH